MPAKWHATALNAAFLSLFLILTTLVASGPGGAKGLIVDIAVPSGMDIAPPSGTTLCGDTDRLLFAYVLPDGRVRLNEEDVEIGRLDSRLKEIIRNKTDRLIFVIPDPAVTFGNVASFIDIAKGRVDHVALLSHAVLRDQGNCGPVIPVRQQPDVPKFDLKFVRLWPW